MYVYIVPKVEINIFEKHSARFLSKYWESTVIFTISACEGRCGSVCNWCHTMDQGLGPSRGHIPILPHLFLMLIYIRLDLSLSIVLSEKRQKSPKNIF